MLDQKKIRLVLTKKVYKKRGIMYHVPIVFTNNRYITGQPEVTMDMIEGKILMPEAISSKYPFVVDPRIVYKVADMKWFDMNDSQDVALLELLRLSGKIAKSKSEHDADKQLYDGYLEDLQQEAKHKNSKRDLRFEAETEIRNASIDLRKRTVLLLNVKIQGFAVNPNILSSDEIYDRLMTVAESNPEEVKSCFEKYNPSVSHEAFGVELLHYGILRRDGSRDIYEGTNYITSNVSGLREYLSRKENSSKVDKWNQILKDHKNKAGLNINSEDSIKPEVANRSIPVSVDPVTQVKVALFDDNISLASTILNETSQVASVCKY